MGVNTRVLSTNKITFALVGLVFLLVAVGVFVLQKTIATKKMTEETLQEVSLAFNPEGPYVLLEPRRDGNALILKMFRVASYDDVSYEMTYQSDGIDRGVAGTLNTKDKRDEYTQEILFGTCSKGDTFSIRSCVFDKNVENGTLGLRIKEGKTVYKMDTTWHLQRPDIALGEITSADGHFVYATAVSRVELGSVGFTIVNDLTGAPKLPEGKSILGKVYALNVPVAKKFPEGKLKIELAESASSGTVIARYDEAKNEWVWLDTKIDGSVLSANSPSNGIFAVFTSTGK